MPTVRRDVTCARRLVASLVALGWPRRNVTALDRLRMSEPTFSRHRAYLEEHEPGFGSPEWRIKVLMAEVDRIRREQAAESRASTAGPRGEAGGARPGCPRGISPIPALGVSS